MAKDYSKLFDTKHLNKDLKKRSLRSGAVTLSSQGAKFVIHLGSTMILARILTPDDYGMMAMVVAITGFASLFINLGLSTATIQRAEITHEQVSTLFWINTGIGVLVMLIVASLSPVVAWFYKTPELKLIVLALSFNFLINGLAVQHQALLNRQMRFVALAAIQIGAMVSGIVAAIFLAVKGFGYWALVCNSLTVSSVSMIGGWIASGWRPGLPRRDAGVGEMIRFGSDIVGFNIINYFSRNLDNILIGRYHGSSALGFYSKAYQLLMMPISNLRDPMNKVAMPALSRLQNEPEKYRNYYIKYVSILCFLSMPLVALLFVISDNIIMLLLGDQWIGVVLIFKILAVVSFIQPASSTRGLVLLTVGNSRRYLLLGALGSIMVITSFFIGVRWGAVGVATAYAIQTYVFLFPNMMLGFYKTPISIKDFIYSLHKPAISSIFMAFSCYYIKINIEQYSDLFVSLFVSIIAFFVYLIVFLLIPGGKRDLLTYIDYGKSILRK